MTGLNPKKILLVRNDNVGDLVCSIPAIQLIRRKFPQAHLHLLVNSYNAPVVEPLVPKWVDQLVVYQKTKHVGLNPGQLLHLVRFYSQLRREGYDTAVLLVGGDSRQARSFASWAGVRQVIGYGAGASGPSLEKGLHEVEYSWKLAAYLCESRDLPPPEIMHPLRASGTMTAIQITSRKPGNRWDVRQFAELGEKIKSARGEKSVLLWSPGHAGTATHPGDDEKAGELLEMAPGAFDPHPTATLMDLMDVLRGCRTMMTPDGGAMHLATAMGVRVVAMFGQSEPERWRPWTPRAVVLQSPSQTICDISVDDVFTAWKKLDASPA